MKDRRPFLFYLSILLVVFPIFIFAWYLLTFTVNVPFWDQWSEVSYLQKFLENNLSLADLYHQHVDNRPVFPTIIALLLGVLTKYDVRYETVLIFIIFTLTFFLLFLLFRKDHGFDTASMILFLPVSWFFFNLTLISNFVWGIYVSHVLVILLFIGAVLLLDRTVTFDFGFFLAIGAAVIASFSFAGGLYIWPACGLLILFRKNTQKLKMFAVWATVAAMVYLTYFWNYQKPLDTPSFLFFISSPLDAVIAFVISAGSNITHNNILSIAAGILILCILAGLLITNMRDLSPGLNGKWISMVFFSLLVSAGVVFARGGWSVYVGLSMRYYPVTFLGIISIYCIALNYAGISKNGPGIGGIRDLLQRIFTSRKILINFILLGMAAMVLCAGIGLHTVPGLNEGIKQKIFFENASYLLTTCQYQSEGTLSAIYPNPPYLIQETEFLRSINYSVFVNEIPEIKGLPKLNGSAVSLIEELNGNPVPPEPVIIRRSKNSDTGITGWALDSGSLNTADSVFISINDKIDITTRYPLEREDIAEQYNSPYYLHSGFSAYFSSEVFEEGENTISIKVVAANTSGYYQSDPVRIMAINSTA
jgi:hypothetical protein